MYCACLYHLENAWRADLGLSRDLKNNSLPIVDESQHAQARRNSGFVSVSRVEITSPVWNFVIKTSRKCHQLIFVLTLTKKKKLTIYAVDPALVGTIVRLITKTLMTAQTRDGRDNRTIRPIGYKKKRINNWIMTSVQTYRFGCNARFCCYDEKCVMVVAVK